MTVQLTNCKPCMKDKHDECLNPETCLCAVETNHNEPTIKINYDKPISKESIESWDIVQNNIQKENDETQPLLFSNKQWGIVSELIQNDYHFLTLRETKKIWYYDEDEGVYRPDGDTIIDESCQKLVNTCTIKTRNEVKATIKSNKTMIRSEELFETTHINTLNGILDPKTFELYSHSHTYHTTTKLPFAVNFKSKNLKLWNHILTIIDEKDINLIIELIWICISGNNPFKKLFVFKGIQTLLDRNVFLYYLPFFLCFVSQLLLMILDSQSFLLLDFQFLRLCSFFYQ